MSIKSPGNPGNDILFAQSGVPVGIPSSGSIANNGALTGLTAFLTTYPDIFLWFPANAIAAGVAAGFYYCQMSSTTAGTIFNNTYTSGEPTIPASPTAFVTTGPGAYVQTTGVLAGLSFTVPANSLGPKGRLRMSLLFQANNSAGSKSIISALGGVTFLSTAVTTTPGQNIIREIFCRGKTGAQITAAVAVGSYQAVATTPGYLTVDTTTALALVLNFNNNTATDWAVYEYVGIEVLPH